MHSTTEAFGLLRRWPPSRFKTNEATFQRCRWTAESIFVLFVICLTITSWRSFPAPYALLGLGAADSFWNSMMQALVENETTRSCQSRSFKLFASESFIWQRRRANTDQRKIAHKYGTAMKSPNSVKENGPGGMRLLFRDDQLFREVLVEFSAGLFWGLLGEMWTLCSQIAPASLSVSWLSFTCVLFENRVNTGRTIAALVN